MSIERSVSPDVDMEMFPLEDLAAQHAKELADLEMIQELELKHAKQRAELRVKQDAELARRKREREAKLRSVSSASHGRKRSREDDVPREKEPGKS